MPECGHRAVLIITQEVADTSTNVARQRIELQCRLDAGHPGHHQDSAHREQWQGQDGRITTLLRHETEE